MFLITPVKMLATKFFCKVFNNVCLVALDVFNVHIAPSFQSRPF